MALPSCWADFDEPPCYSKRVIQASTASSHRVGKCSIEPSKQSRIRRSSFWSHRRSTALWETALSSKERSRRVNCPMLVHYNTAVDTCQCSTTMTLEPVQWDTDIDIISFASFYIVGLLSNTPGEGIQHEFLLSTHSTSQYPCYAHGLLFKRARQWQAVTNAHYNLRRESGIVVSFGWLGNLADSLCAQLDCGGSNTPRARWTTNCSHLNLNCKWRASLVPAAAVIPAPLAYTTIVAVKRLVVGLNCLGRSHASSRESYGWPPLKRVHSLPQYHGKQTASFMISYAPFGILI